MASKKAKNHVQKRGKNNLQRISLFSKGKGVICLQNVICESREAKQSTGLRLKLNFFLNTETVLARRRLQVAEIEMGRRASCAR